VNTFKKSKVCAAALLAIGSGSLLPTTGAYAQEAKLERVEITGSSIRRIDAETAVPVQVVTKQDIARSGVTSVEALLQGISALSSAGGTATTQGAGNTTYGNSTVSLRGLDSARTLVLVNGRRLATFASGSAAVNVASIPLAAIERVEVLKDGASSIYGSDAMAGVVNFILTKSMTGVELAAYASTPTGDGGGKTERASITAGFGDGTKFRAVVSGTFEKETALFGRDRDFTRTATVLPYYSSGATGQGNIEGAVNPGKYPDDRQPNFGTSPGTGYGNPLADQGKCGDISMVLNPTPTNKVSPTLKVGAPYCAFDTGPFVGLVPARELMALTGNFGLQLNKDHELFADVLYSESEVVQTFQTPPLRRGFAAGSNARLEAEKVDPSLILYPSNPNYKIAADYLAKYGYTALIGQPLAITSRVFDYGGRQTTDKSTQSRVVVGARGTIANQDYEVAFMDNQSKLAGKYTGGVFSVTDYNRIINDPANNWNPWAPGGLQTGQLAEKLKAAAYIGPSLDALSKNQGFDGRLTGELFSLPAGMVQYAAGVQARKDSLSRTPAEKPGTGDIAGAGGAAFAINKDRNVKAAFGELVIPVIKNVEATAAVRTDRYNDFGTANTYKLSGTWRPSKMVLVRASHNTGFRAPTLPDLYQPQIIGTTEQFDDPATGQTDLQVKGVTGGNINLKPEESKATVFGLVLSPNRNLSVGLDAFKIRIDNIIQTPGAQEVVSRFRAGDPAFKNLVTLSGNDIDQVVTVTSNLGQANVEGVDLFANFRADVGPGRLDLVLNGTYMTKFDQTSPSGNLSRKVGTIVEADGTPVLGADGGGVILRWKHGLTAAYTLGSWTGSVTQNYTSRYRAGNDLNDKPTYVGAYSLFDAAVVYRGIKNLSLGLGVKNLSDKVPDIYVPASNQFQTGYDVTMYDPRGRTIFLNANYKF
jgi:iron complex outermembrane receptor protein